MDTMKIILDNVKEGIHSLIWHYWYNHIYLYSAGWSITRNMTLDAQGRRCSKCKDPHYLHVHHLNYRKTPKMKWWHFLPFARFFIYELDYSDKIVLCAKHHREAHGIGW